MNSFSVQDIYAASYRNQFTTNELVLNQDKKNRVYFITALRGTNWTMKVVNQGDSYTRTGSTDTQFFQPISGNRIVFTGTTEVSGFYIEFKN
jgi:hypothetical protein